MQCQQERGEEVRKVGGHVRAEGTRGSFSVDSACLYPQGRRMGSTHTHVFNSSFIGAVAPLQGGQTQPVRNPPALLKWRHCRDTQCLGHYWPARATLTPSPKGRAAADRL